MAILVDPPMSFHNYILAKLIELAMALESGDSNLSDSLFREINSFILDERYPNAITGVANWFCKGLFVRFHKLSPLYTNSHTLLSSLLVSEQSFCFFEAITLDAIKKSIDDIKKPLHLVITTPILNGLEELLEDLCIEKVTLIAPDQQLKNYPEDEYQEDEYEVRKLVANNGGDIVKRMDEIKRSREDESIVVVWMCTLNTLLHEPVVFAGAMSTVKRLKPVVMVVTEFDVNLNCDNFTKRLAEAFHFYRHLNKHTIFYPITDKGQRGIENALDEKRMYRHEPLVKWRRRLHCAGFSQIPFSISDEENRFRLFYREYDGALADHVLGFVCSAWKPVNDEIVIPFNETITWKRKKWSEKEVRQYLTFRTDERVLMNVFEETKSRKTFDGPLLASLQKLIDSTYIPLQNNEQQHYVDALIIDQFFELLKRRSDEFPNLYIKHHSLSTYISQFLLLKEDCVPYLEKHLNVENDIEYIQDESKLFMPACVQEKHWILICIDMELRVILCLDSIRSRDSLDSYAVEKQMLHKGINKYILPRIGYPNSNWTFHHVDNIPHQTNLVDCGIFVMKYADCLCHDDHHFPFTQAEMIHFRSAIAFDICRNKLRSWDLDSATQNNLCVDTTKVGKDGGPQEKSSRKRKNTSEVWKGFHKVEEDGKIWVRCKVCKKKLRGESTRGTSNLRKHFNKCFKDDRGFHVQLNDSTKIAFENQGNVQLNDSTTIVVQNLGHVDELNGSKTIVVDQWNSSEQERSRLDLAKMIIKNGYPLNMSQCNFFQVFIKNLQPLFNICSQDDIKADVLQIYKDEKKRLTEYLNNPSFRFCLTIKMQSYGDKKIVYCCLILSFINEEWELEQKILAFKNFRNTVTTQTLCEVFESTLLDWKIDRNAILLVVANEVTCANHCVVGELDGANHAFFKFLVEDIECFSETSIKLESIVELSKAFTQLQQIDVNLTKELNTEIDICKLLKVFHDFVCTSSRIDVSFENIVCFYENMLEWKKSEHSYVRSMTERMMEKFDRYWDDSGLAMGIMAVVDPRFKLPLVKYAYEQIFNTNASSQVSKFHDLLICTYNKYANAANHQTQSSSTVKADNFSKWKELKEKDELNIYLSEKAVELEQESDVLAWWKANTLKYPVLSRMARDYLSVSSSTVASKFSRIDEIMKINPSFHELQPEITQALICGQDWLEF